MQAATGPRFAALIATLLSSSFLPGSVPWQEQEDRETPTTFSRVERAWPGAVTSIEESTLSKLEIREGRLFRSIRGIEHELLSVFGKPTGRILSLCAHPMGTVFVAAEQGLFATAQGFDVLDPLDLRDGVPKGRPVGLVLDRKNRLWLATEAGGFACIDTRFFYGRSFSAQDGLPKAPFSGLALGTSSALLLKNEDGIWRYLLADGAGPSLDVGGAARRTAGRDGSLSLELGGAGLGGVSFRYRLGASHLWQPLTVTDGKARITGLRPGRQGIRIVALDRELNASGELVLDLVVPYPELFDKATLLPLLALGALFLFAAFCWRAHRAGGTKQQYVRAALSTIVSTIFVCQVLVACIPHGKSWPFVGFDMYTERYEHLGLLYKPRLIGIDSNRRRFAIHPRQAGWSSDGYWQALVPLIHESATRGKDFLDAFRERNPGLDLQQYIVETQKTRLSSEGPVPVAPTVLSWYPRTLR